MKLCFPERILEQHLVVLGKTGAGKSSALRHVVEHLLRKNKRVCIIDIKGDWWGLKVAADGKGPGFPVVAFGNFREPRAVDVPINPQSGPEIAELITSGNRPCIIGFRGWMPSEVIDFWIGHERNHWKGFASTLFSKNEGELYVVISECHNFAPKGRVDDPKSGRMLHWTNRLLSEGRGLGMTFMLDSQRPQKVHNDTLTSCETLVAMRVTYPADRDALALWIKGCGDKETGQQVLDTVAQMARGEAWVWSPEVGFGPERVKFPMFTTFDSFAPAQLQKKVSQSGWAEVDLDAVKTKLAAVIEEAKGNDPAELKKTIADLKKRLQEAERVKPQLDPQAVEKAVQSAIAQQGRVFQGHLETMQKMFVGKEVRIGKIGDALLDLSGEAKKLAEAWSENLKLPEFKGTLAGIPVVADPRVSPRTLELRTPTQTVRVTNIGSDNGTKKLRAGAERLLAALVSWHPQGMKEGQWRAHAQLKKSGTYSTYKSDLRQGGYITENGDLIFASQAGIDYFGGNVPESPKTTEEVVALWRNKLRDGARRMLDVLVQAGGEFVDKETLAQRANLTESGTFTTYVSDLRTAHLIVSEKGRGFAANKEVLFLG